MIKYEFEYIEIDKLSPNPLKLRLHLDKEAIMHLAESIGQYGVFSPILVGKTAAGLQIIAGERRWRAAKIAGLNKIPAMIVDASALELLLLFIEENLQRENINFIELAICINKLLQRPGITKKMISSRIKISEEKIEEILKVLNLPNSIQDAYVSKKLSDKELSEILRKNPVVAIHHAK